MFAFQSKMDDIERADLVVRSTKSALTNSERMRFEMDFPTQARLRELFNYDPIDGVLIWRERPVSDFKSAAAQALFVARWQEKVAGHIEKQGYRVIFVDGVSRKAHKLIWLFVIGEWVSYPQFEIDHVNGNRSDNRIQNLRKVTKSGNQRNGSLRINNASGVNGVNWVHSKQKWIARIWDGPKHRFLGAFSDIEDARQARIRAERELLYYEGHGKPVRAYVTKRARMSRTLRMPR